MTTDRSKLSDLPMVPDLAALWRSTRLRAAATDESRRGRTQWPTLRAALLVGTGSRGVDGAARCDRTVPSAGAIYPFDVFGCIVGEEAGEAFVIDHGPGDLRALPVRPAAAALRAALSSPAAMRLGAGALLLVVAVRPWLSMAKYGERGYFYSLLDAGHAAANLAILLGERGYGVVQDCHFDRAAMADLLDLGASCHEPLAVLVVEGASGLSLLPADAAVPAAADVEERTVWTRLDACGLLGTCGNAALLAPGTGLGLPAARRETAAETADPVGLSPYLLHRHSARGYLDRTLPVAALAGVIRDARVPLAQTWGCRPFELAARLVHRRADGGRGFYDLRDGELVRAAGRADGGDGPATAAWSKACMGQVFVDKAAAMIVVHCPAIDWQSPDLGNELVHLHLRAGHWMQGLYLAAARHGLGVTAIGGFDDSLCSGIAGLEPGCEVVYAALLGVEDVLGHKVDRRSVAFSHGFTRPFEAADLMAEAVTVPDGPASNGPARGGPLAR